MIAADVSSAVAAPSTDAVPMVPDPLVSLANAAASKVTTEPATTPATEAAPATPVETQPATETAATTEPATTIPETGDDGEFDSVAEVGMPMEMASVTRGQEIWANHKFVKALAAPPEIDPSTGLRTGGIGHEPTIDDIREYHQAKLNLDRFIGDLQSPDPTALVENLFQTDAAAASRLAVTLPRFLANCDPVAYEQMATGVAENFVAAIVDHARAMQDPKAREAWKFVANGLKFYLSDGKQQLPSDVLERPAQDPLATREQELAQREQEVNRFHQQQHQQNVQQFHNTLVNVTNNALAAEIAAQIAPVKAAVSEQAFHGIVQGILTEVQEAVKMNPTAWQAIQSEMRLANQSVGNPAAWQASINKIVGRYVQFAKPAILQKRGPVVKGYTKQVVQQAQQAPRPAASTQRPLPGGSPPAASQQAGNQPATAPASRFRQSNAEKIMNEMLSDLGAPVN